MISEGPALIEALPGELQNTLNGAVPPDEEILIAVRGTTREAFAATGKRLLHLLAPVISGSAPVEIRETPLTAVSEVRSEAKPVGGRLVWMADGVEHAVDYPTYDVSKYNLVTIRLKQMIGERHTPKPPPQAPAFQPTGGDQPCPKCGSGIPATASWCPNCGLQAFDPCWQCGRALLQGGNFCAYCGTPNTEPAVVQCRECDGVVGQGQSFCPQCGAQARIVCGDCDRPQRKDWKSCPYCAGEPVWAEEGMEPSVARLTGDEPEDPSAWLSNRPAPQDAEKLNRSATQAYQAERYEEAARLFKQAVEADPTNSGYWTNLGVAHSAAGDDSQALAAYRRATELNPNEISAFLFMGQLHLERESYTEAREAWEQVVRIDPDSAEAEEARENLRSLEDV